MKQIKNLTAAEILEQIKYTLIIDGEITEVSNLNDANGGFTWLDQFDADNDAAPFTAESREHFQNKLFIAYAAGMLPAEVTETRSDRITADGTGYEFDVETAGQLNPYEETEDPAEAAQAATEAPEQPTTDEQKEEENPMSITPAERIQACNIIIRRGGYRERDLLTRPHEITRGETWNAEHKVVNVTETTPDPDGYRPGCAVDLVTRSIVG